MASKKYPSIKKISKLAVIITASVILLMLCGLLSYNIVYNSRIYPNLSVAGEFVGGKTQDEASTTLSENIKPPSELTLIFQDQTFNIKASDIDLVYNFSASVAVAYGYTRTGNFPLDIKRRMELLFSPLNVDLVIGLNPDKLNKIVSVISGQISIDPIDPAVTKTAAGIAVEKGSPGRDVDTNKLISLIWETLSQNQSTQIPIPVNYIDNSINEAEAQVYSSRAGKLLNKNIIIKFEFTEIPVRDTDMLNLIGAKGGYNSDEIYKFIEKIASDIERDPQNPKFVFENGKVTEFRPALPGIKVEKGVLENLIVQKLTELELGNEKSMTVDMPVTKVDPEIDTGDVNDFGIKELIGRGTSTYFHSIPGRVHNVTLASQRINGTLVKPGETFSFNNALGDVSAFTGYQQAYIIKDGKTILGDGGGVCQVSTTLFRALLNAGLPITERQAHAYRVGYYEQDSPPGLDATVFSPSPDLKFINDTGHYILIEAKADSKNYSLVFELYGTKDGRVSSISKPVVTNITAPPPDVYQDDPTLPVGTIKQVDYKAWGAKTTFHYVVTKDGSEIINKTFISNYKPWAAVYLRGTGPAI